VTLGQIPGSGGSQRVARIAGLTRAVDMMMLGRRIPAPEAHSWGLLTRVADDTAALDRILDDIVTTLTTMSTLAVGQVAERNNRILVTTVSYAPSITGAQCNPNVFRVNANAFMQSSALTSWLTKNVAGKRYFFIGPDYEMGRSSISAFQDDIKRLGGTDVGNAFPPLGAKDFTPYVGQIRSARPDVIMTATAGNDTVLCSPNSRNMASSPTS
jgi:ABC-type branched-subunit amino acid transport system substrate-binding protein